MANRDLRTTTERPLRVMIVDDSRAARMAMLNTLTREGIQVAGEAENGYEAIGRYFVEQPDAVAMDMVIA